MVNISDGRKGLPAEISVLVSWTIVETIDSTLQIFRGMSPDNQVICKTGGVKFFGIEKEGKVSNVVNQIDFTMKIHGSPHQIIMHSEAEGSKGNVA